MTDVPGATSETTGTEQREVAERFAALQATWGPWGLAWWEALLRAADGIASRKNEKKDDAKGGGS